MPEALAVVLVFVVSVAIYVGARIRSSDPRLHRHDDEIKRLEQRGVWLEERLKRAEREQWGEEMKRGLREDMEDVKHERARLMAARHQQQIR